MSKHEELIERIKAIREAKGWKQRQLADEMKVPHSYPSRWETGMHVPDRWHMSTYARIGNENEAELIRLRDDADAEARARRAAAKEEAAKAEEAAAAPQSSEGGQRRGRGSQ